MNSGNQDPLPLVLLPGLGADARVFKRQTDVFDNLITPDWIPFEPGESMPEYARRLAAAIDPGTPCMVGGLSYGGMLAPYVAGHLDAKKCFLISTIRRPSELPRRYRVFTPVVKHMPWLTRLICRTSQLVARVALWTLWWLLPKGLQGLMKEYIDMPPVWFARAVYALLTWNDPSAGETPINRLGETVPVYHIHGQRDYVLPCRKTTPDEIIPDAGHVSNYTHADEVNRFLREHM